MSHKVLILDDDDDLRTTLSDTLHQLCDADCVAVSDVASMIEAGDRVLACEVAFVDVNLGANRPSGLDAYNWLVDHGFTGRVVFLTGHARVQTMIDEAVRAGAAQVVQKPASLATLCGLIEGSSR